jgi:hypothetical protein
MLPQKRIDKLRELADSLVSMGFVLPDFLGSVGSGDTREETFSNYRNFLINLKPGVTELYIHAAKESDEIKAITNAWRARDFDYEIFMSAEMKNFIDSLEIHLIGWRKLQRLQIEQLGTYVENFHQTLASDFWIEQNYPNPFNSSTSIEYFLPASKEIALLIFDMSGREVKTVQKGYQLAGWQQTIWNGTDNAGDVVVSGLYFCRFQSGRSSTSIKLSFIK